MAISHAHLKHVRELPLVIVTARIRKPSMARFAAFVTSMSKNRSAWRDGASCFSSFLWLSHVRNAALGDRGLSSLTPCLSVHQVSLSSRLPHCTCRVGGERNSCPCGALGRAASRRNPC